ncbi:RagB/SusD family nutrient uptake outer membrane protein [Mucilaginibacter terrae]|uniref:RagB/SusD family nutrient uptake outer membrane protein n=1 Tax=Mucilaginibacter terrae TaxID=1955052 RepID=A0ABU3GUN6_9SPHI|nr:RagB/SusD family nutrient uptake outer membrane protein [Mucilaginibacter terrae]MDT3402350.1 hypothetical protein [Mucilaginibacter terrae]
MKYFYSPLIVFIAAGIVMLAAGGCNKYLDVPLPVNRITGDAAFISDAATSSVVTGLIQQISQAGYTAGSTGVGYTTALYADETQNLNPAILSNALFYANGLNTSSPSGTTQWTAIYQQLYQVNLAIEKISSGTGTLSYRNQWLGESYFLRGYLLWILTNLYGDAPMPLTSNFELNRTIANSPQASLYSQIIKDLKMAQTLLTVDYKDGYGAATTDRSRPNQLAVRAMLARVYLYQQDWANAEAEATSVISAANYQLVPLSQAFLINNKEAVWSFATLTGSTTVVSEYTLYNNAMPAVIPAGRQLTSYGVNAAMSTDLVNAFEPGDNRLQNWVRQTTVPATATAPALTYYFPNKYKASAVGTEHNVVLRLAEAYLIRAEARAQQNNLTGGQDDLNAVRQRAGLGLLKPASPELLVAAILKERRTELFTEFGHRLFDLRRTGTLNTVMNAYAPVKGGSWSAYKQYWPRPAEDLQTNPNIQQTPGY